MRQRPRTTRSCRSAEEVRDDLDAIVNEVFEREVGKLPAEKQALAREAKPLAADKRTPEQTQLYKDLPSLNVDRGSVYLYEQQRVADLNKANEKNQADIRAKRPADNFVACLTEPSEHAPPTHLFSRGDFNQPRQVVPPGDLSVLPVSNVVPENDPGVSTTGRRLAWARHLTSGQHPLVSRGCWSTGSDAPFWTRHCRFTGRLWPAWRAAHSSRASRLARRRADLVGLAAQTAAAGNRHFGGLSTVFDRSSSPS